MAGSDEGCSMQVDAGSGGEFRQRRGQQQVQMKGDKASEGERPSRDEGKGQETRVKDKGRRQARDEGQPGMG